MSRQCKAQPKSLRWTVPGVVIALLLVGCTVTNLAQEADLAADATVQGPSHMPTEEPGPIVDFSVQDFSGREVRLSDYRGQVVLVNFWATWCSPCREEMPLLQEYYQAHRDRGFILVGINVSGRPDEVAAFVEEAGYSFPIWLDPPGKVLIDLGVHGLPASLLVDAEGHRRKLWVGPLTRELLDAEVTPYLLQPTGYMPGSQPLGFIHLSTLVARSQPAPAGRPHCQERQCRPGPGSDTPAPTATPGRQARFAPIPMPASRPAPGSRRRWT